MHINNIVFIVLFLAALSLFTYNLLRIRTYLMLGRSENRFSFIGKRLYKVLGIGIGQAKIFRDPVAGLMHAMIFWGFLVLITAVMEAFIQGFYSGFSLGMLGIISQVFFASQDLFGMLVILSVFYALFRRYVLHPKRLQGDGSTNADATFILFLILGVMLTMFGVNATKAAVHPEYVSYYKAHFIASHLTSLFAGNEVTFYNIFWWGHIVIILTFMNYLPYSKHFHIVTSLPNVYLSKIGPQTLILKK